MENLDVFRRDFQALTGALPFPWQETLYNEHFSNGAIPSACDLPTGLGKTSVIAIWLIALAHHPGKLPRRLVYVVNRRTVVDQTTTEVERIREYLMNKPELRELRASLTKLCASVCEFPLAISTLRGRFADNRQWSADPARPAVIVGTVDMIGSRLLFSGYGVGFKAMPLHAGFLGQDALIVHDEAHLEPAFQTLLRRIAEEQTRCKEFARLNILELTATRRTSGRGRESFGLTKADYAHPIAKQRIAAHKQLVLNQVEDETAVPNTIAEMALRHKNNEACVLIIVRTVADVKRIVERLTNKREGVTAANVQQLTGTMRGWERDRLAKEDPVFQRFLPERSRNPVVLPQPGAVYLVCTAAGEVGVDISADHLVCDLSTFESMTQRFGRVNRYGMREDTAIAVVHTGSFKVDKDPLAAQREKTLELLNRLDGDASPRRLTELTASLPDSDRGAAFSPLPEIPIATDILFDAWSLTTIREAMPGRPPVEPYLHGIQPWEPPQTQVAWRCEVELIKEDLLVRYPPRELLDDYPLLPHELLRDRSDRVFKELTALAAQHSSAPVWVLDAHGEVSVCTLAELTNKDEKARIEGVTILLPPEVGGLKGGMLDGNSALADDVADALVDAADKPRRQRVWDDDPIPPHLRILRTIDLQEDDDSREEEVEFTKQLWHWCTQHLEGGRTSNHVVLWDAHVRDVVNTTAAMIDHLPFEAQIKEAIITAAKFHDHGKRREAFQLALGNSEYLSDRSVVWAKSNRRSAARIPETFRHEFASGLDAQAEPDFAKLTPEMQDLALHLIAVHHGRGRPHFPAEEAFDPERSSKEIENFALATPRRFSRLQQKYGRWGLAYVESILRAADWAASAAEANTESPS